MHELRHALDENLDKIEDDTNKL